MVIEFINAKYTINMTQNQPYICHFRNVKFLITYIDPNFMLFLFYYNENKWDFWYVLTNNVYITYTRFLAWKIYWKRSFAKRRLFTGFEAHEADHCVGNLKQIVIVFQNSLSNVEMSFVECIMKICKSN